MCTTLNFKKEYYDIVQVLGTSSIFGEYRGKKIWVEIEKMMNEISEGTLILIDLRRSNPVDYVFCQYAFGPLFQALEDKSFQRKYVIFQMHDCHQPVFFRGVMKHLKADFPRSKSRDEFISAGKYAKLIDETSTIDYVGKLDQNENTILDVVNKMVEINVENVMDKTGLPAETIVRNLSALIQNYFIVGPFDKTSSSPLYYSFNKYFEQEKIK